MITTTETNPAWTGTLRVVCSWCGGELPGKPCAPHMDGEISHGMCQWCNDAGYDAIRQEIAAADMLQLACLTLTVLPKVSEPEARAMLHRLARRRYEKLLAQPVRSFTR